MEKPGRAFSFPYIPPLGNAVIESLSDGKKFNGMNIIPTSNYGGQPLDDNTKVGDISIIAQPKFNADDNGMLNWGQGSDLVLKFTERLYNPQTGESTKGNDYKIAIGSSNYTALKEILKTNKTKLCLISL